MGRMHASRRAKLWFQQNHIEVTDWPTQSPDLNSFENLWGDVTSATESLKPKTSKKLWQKMREIWHSVPVERCQNLVESMQRRFFTVKPHNINYLM